MASFRHTRINPSREPPARQWPRNHPEIAETQVRLRQLSYANSQRLLEQPQMSDNQNDTLSVAEEEPELHRHVQELQDLERPQNPERTHPLITTEERQEG